MSNIRRTNETKALAERFAQRCFNTKKEFITAKIDSYGDEEITITGRFKGTNSNKEFVIPSAGWNSPKLLDISFEELKVQLALGTLSEGEQVTLFLMLPKKAPKDIVDLLYLNVTQKVVESYVDENVCNSKFWFIFMNNASLIWKHINLSHETITQCLQLLLKAPCLGDCIYNIIKEVKDCCKNYTIPYFILENALFIQSADKNSDTDDIERLASMLEKYPEFNQKSFIENWKQFEIKLLKDTLEEDIKELNKNSNDLLNTSPSSFWDEFIENT